MKLVVCARDIDFTLQAGDLISWHEENENPGNMVGLENVLKNGTGTLRNYIQKSPFIILHLPLITQQDIDDIRTDLDITFREMDTDAKRKWKLEFLSLEQRAQGSLYPPTDTTPEFLKWSDVIPGRIRRDTLRAYNEITRNDVDINTVRIARV